MVGCSAEVLESTISICDYVHTVPSSDDSQRLQAIERLERKLVHAEQHIPDAEMTNETNTDKSTVKIAELFRLAGLIYLYRACMRLSPVSPKVAGAVESAFNILRTLNTCDRSFPLLIVACEAQNDEDRLLVLDLLRRTRASRKIGNLAVAQQFIESSWAQDDLDTAKEVGYVQKFDTIISRSEYLPSFA